MQYNAIQLYPKHAERLPRGAGFHLYLRRGFHPLRPASLKDGMTLTLRVDAPLKAFYTSLPGRMRTKILERAIRTYMKEQHSDIT
jgi:hypothetical protein